jgi:hypothetical protein
MQSYFIIHLNLTPFGVVFVELIHGVASSIHSCFHRCGVVSHLFFYFIVNDIWVV